MSIYRKGLDNVYADVHATRFGALGEPSKPATQAKAVARSPAEAAREAAERSKRKRGEPLNVPLPRTLAWAATLAPDVQPHELIRLYARIANHLALGWEDTHATLAYFEQLLVTNRANRNGFPKQVESELVALRLHYGFLHPERGTIDPWRHLRKR